ncbi:MAG: hypothetical protein HY559_02135 [Gammaproteobacteria bacterium]|nr:hypothetical protein [Gammaproteobacteria bacterium]
MHQNHSRITLFMVVLFLAGCASFETDPSLKTAFRTVTNPILLTRLEPGMTMETVQSLLEKEGISGAFSLPSHRVMYEVRLFEELAQRQRLVLMVDQAQLVKSALILDFEEMGDLKDNEQIFATVLNNLHRRYGRPSFFYERGMGEPRMFSQNLEQEVSTEQFVRVYEWTLEKGVLRLGIPKRLDRKVRIEIQYASPRYLSPFWSIDESLQ